MSTPNTGDVEALADSISGCFSNVTDLPEWMRVSALGRSMRPLTEIAARAVLASDWLAAHDAQVRRERDSLVRLMLAANSRAEEADTALADLRAAVEALADELEDAEIADLRDYHARALRALLAQQHDGGAS